MGIPVLLAAMAVLAFSASGCIIDGSSNPPPPCTPDLYVNWRLVESGTNAVLTCDQVPASTIRVIINGVADDFPCRAGDSTGQVLYQLDVTGTYGVQVQVLDANNQVLSDTGTGNSIYVDCSGLTQTPLIDLAVI